MFSNRTGWDSETNEYSRLLHKKQTEFRNFIDFTLSNPTQSGFQYPEAAIRQAMTKVHPYKPDAQGIYPAREAIAQYYRLHGREIDPSQILLTSSSSESYALLLKLFCDPGDEILLPAPSYPLFSFLVGAEGVAGIPYQLQRRKDSGWVWEMSPLKKKYSGKTRGLVIVSPNNPTGTTLGDRELRDAFGWCADHDLPVILDEVFLDYGGIQTAGNAAAVAQEKGTLLLTLGGLSKCAGFPQMKLGWIAVSGPAPLREEAMSRLSFLNDAYLTVGTPVQNAAADLLQIGQGIRAQIQSRILKNEMILCDWARVHSAFEVFPRGGGWYAVCRLPAGQEDEQFVYRLLDDQSVAVHPGYFYDIEDINVIVISLIVETARLEEGLRRIAALQITE